MALTKSKKHYVGLIFADGDNKGGLAIPWDKNDYRGILAGLGRISGRSSEPGHNDREELSWRI